MGPAIPKTLDDIYNDYTTRREALLTALTDGEGLGDGTPFCGTWGFECTTARRSLERGRTRTQCPSPSADAAEFYEACDPGKDNLCLYGAVMWNVPGGHFTFREYHRATRKLKPCEAGLIAISAEHFKPAT